MSHKEPCVCTYLVSTTIPVTLSSSHFLWSTLWNDMKCVIYVQQVCEEEKRTKAQHKSATKCNWPSTLLCKVEMKRTSQRGQKIRQGPDSIKSQWRHGHRNSIISTFDPNWMAEQLKEEEKICGTESIIRKKM